MLKRLNIKGPVNDGGKDWLFGLKGDKPGGTLPNIPFLSNAYLAINDFVLDLALVNTKKIVTHKRNVW